MLDGVFGLKQIFGLKIKEIRQEKGITYQDLREKTGMSISYLSEIENGKKYPKSDKIMLLAQALEVEYDELVSLKVPKKLQPIIDLIQSDFFKAFPLKEFGLDPQKLVEIVSQDPERINAFINTVLQVARNFELNNEKFFYAALRSYQELQNNYFPDLETAVRELNLEFPELSEIPFTRKTLTEILLQLGVRVSFEDLASNRLLKNIRSIYQPDRRMLLVNEGLSSGQVNFLLAREIAFQWLRLSKRPHSTPPVGSFDFEAILNNYRSSYFAAALMMPEKQVIADVKDFAAQDAWDPDLLMSFLSKYDVTPEMLMQRLTNILPTHFDLKDLFFLRFLGEKEDFTLTKELHLTGQHNPHANELNEHYCRRWVSIDILQDILVKKKVSMTSEIQISRYWQTKNEYLCLSLAFPNVSNPEEAISVTIGFLLNKKSKNRLRFVDDTSIVTKEVHTTCERCAISDCEVRVAKPRRYERDIQEQRLLQAVGNLIDVK